METDMKDTIARVLEEYKGRQVNLDSETAIEMIADQIVDELEMKYVVTDKDHLSDEYWDKIDTAGDDLSI